MLAKLKTQATGRNQIAAVNGSMIDLRMTAVVDSGAADQVAIWDAETKTFRIVAHNSVPSGATAIAEFVEDSNARIELASEQRKSTFKLAQTSNWIWDFEDHEGTEVNRTLIRPGTTKSTSRQAPAASVAARLLPPTFSLAPGTYPLSLYPVPFN